MSPHAATSANVATSATFVNFSTQTELEKLAADTLNLFELVSRLSCAKLGVFVVLSQQSCSHKHILQIFVFITDKTRQSCTDLDEILCVPAM